MEFNSKELLDKLTPAFDEILEVIKQYADNPEHYKFLAGYMANEISRKFNYQSSKTYLTKIKDY